MKPTKFHSDISADNVCVQEVNIKWTGNASGMLLCTKSSHTVITFEVMCWCYSAKRISTARFCSNKMLIEIWDWVAQD
jgi:serine acetyltransferase